MEVLVSPQTNTIFSVHALETAMVKDAKSALQVNELPLYRQVTILRLVAYRIVVEKILYTRVIILARFPLKMGYPTIMFFEEGTNNSVAHDGPVDLGSLMEFVNDNTGRGPPIVKVCRKI